MACLQSPAPGAEVDKAWDSGLSKMAKSLAARAQEKQRLQAGVAKDDHPVVKRQQLFHSRGFRTDGNPNAWNPVGVHRVLAKKYCAGLDHQVRQCTRDVPGLVLFNKTLR